MRNSGLNFKKNLQSTDNIVFLSQSAGLTSGGQILKFLVMKPPFKKRAWLWIGIPAALFTLTAAYKAVNPPTLYDRLKLFGAVMARIDKDYLDPKPPQDIIRHAIEGVVSNLDPHSAYLTQTDYDAWNQNYEGYCGIGITLDLIRNRFTVISVIKGGPAEASGIRPGDRIVRVDGSIVIGLDDDQIVGKIMGQAGTRIQIGVERTGWPSPRDFIVMRGEVHPESIPDVYVLKPGVGYCRIIRFSSTTGEELQRALASLTAKHIERLVLDLRGNGGGYLETAVRTASAFIPSGRRIAYTQGRNADSFREYRSDSTSAPMLVPMIVLIDRFTASASEIVAGALQDWDRAWIVGETSFGKGLVQSQYRFDDGSTLLLTTARYFTPCGRLIQRPYADKTVDRYYAEIMVDSLREVVEHSGSRPVHQTLVLKRKVLGGGGISPDTAIPALSDTVDESFEKLTASPERFFFTFGERYARNHPELKQDFDLFLKHYQPDNLCLKQFYAYLRENNAPESAVDFHRSQDRIRFQLKQSFAEILWSDAARYRVALVRDRTLSKAVEECFPQAESLLKQAYFKP
jgi:carboxyl-terminal processing protease